VQPARQRRGNHTHALGLTNLLLDHVGDARGIRNEFVRDDQDSFCSHLSSNLVSTRWAFISQLRLPAACASWEDVEPSAAACTKASRSAFSCSLCVSVMPCGAPG